MKFTFLAVVMVVGPAWGQNMPVYYDYVEDGVLKGGRFVIDPNDPVHRAAFGLDTATRGPAWPVSTIIDNGPSQNRVLNCSRLGGPSK